MILTIFSSNRIKGVPPSQGCGRFSWRLCRPYDLLFVWNDDEIYRLEPVWRVCKRPTGMKNKKNLLFVCSRNQWRSPTAERMFSRSEEFAVRSRGVSASAVRRLARSDVAWADVIFVMEADHKRQLLKLFRSEVEHRPVHVLDIPDEYPFMDPELVDLIDAGVRAVLGTVTLFRRDPA